MSSMNKIADRLHKIAVSGLMGLTLIGAVTFSFQVFHYITTPRKVKLPAERKTSEFTENSFRMASFSRITKLFSFIRLHLPVYASPFSSEKKAWNVLKVNHIAVATTDLEKSINFYRDALGAKTSDPVPMPEHGVTTVFVELLNTKLELLLPLGSQSPIENFFVKNSSGGMHHICLEVDNIENAIQDLKMKKVRLLGDKPKIGAHGKPVIFLHPKDCGGVLIELEEV